MSGANATVDILSGMPIWVQVAANLGMFVVAVIAAVFGRRWSMGITTPSEYSERHTSEAIHSERIATALEGMLKVMQETEREAATEREVRRRLREHGVIEET
jgi:hypothetical protein